MLARFRVRKYIIQISVVIITIAIATFIWKNKDIKTAFKYHSTIRTRNKNLDEKKLTTGMAWDDENKRKGDLKRLSNAHSLLIDDKAGDRSGIAKDQKQILATQKGYLATDNIVKVLKQLISELIDLRVTLDGGYHKMIDEKYSKFQKILQSMERNSRYSQKKGQIRTSTKTEPLLCDNGKRVIGKGNKKLNGTRCRRLPLSETLTIVIDNQNLSKITLKTLLQEIEFNQKDIKVLVIHAEGKRNDGNTTAHQINQLIAKVSTPFVYMSRQLESWTTQIDFDRLVDFMLSKEDVVAVGNAVVDNSNGHWSHGCIQSRLKRYVLKYERGYHTSDLSCIKCDALEGPFLVRSDFLQKNKFSNGLNHGYYEDWFLRVQGHIRHEEHTRKKNEGKPLGAIYSCPDATSLVAMTEFDSSNMEKMVDLWDIKKIVHSDSNTYWFGCKRAMPKKGEKCRVGRGMAVPPCCLDNLMAAIIFVMRKCQEYGVACELIEGTLLGAVKFHNVLPWERDADIAFYAGQFNRLTKMADDVKKKGYNFTVREKPRCCVDGKPSGGTILITAHGWNIELYGSHSLDSYTKIKEGRAPTRIQFAGVMLNVPDNPGQVMKNRYGKEIYKHAEHWMINQMNSGWAEYNPKFFNKCEAPGHHACLDQFEADGSVQFTDN